ncbi:unnamed protein product, partial [Arabidopsis halleri]
LLIITRVFLFFFNPQNTPIKLCRENHNNKNAIKKKMPARQKLPLFTEKPVIIYSFATELSEFK